jgi:hypothetical protein
MISRMLRKAKWRPHADLEPAANPTERGVREIFV